MLHAAGGLIPLPPTRLINVINADLFPCFTVYVCVCLLRTYLEALCRLVRLWLLSLWRLPLLGLMVGRASGLGSGVPKTGVRESRSR